MLTNTPVLHSFTFLASLLSAHVQVLSYIFSYKLVGIKSLNFSLSFLNAPHCTTDWESILEDIDTF